MFGKDRFVLHSDCWKPQLSGISVQNSFRKLRPQDDLQTSAVFELFDNPLVTEQKLYKW